MTSYCLISEVSKIQFMLAESHRYLYSLFSNHSKDTLSTIVPGSRRYTLVKQSNIPVNRDWFIRKNY